MANKEFTVLRIEELCFGRVNFGDSPHGVRVIKTINKTPDVEMVDFGVEYQEGLNGPGDWYTVVWYDVKLWAEEDGDWLTVADILWDQLEAEGSVDDISTSWILPHKGLHRASY